MSNLSAAKIRRARIAADILDAAGEHVAAEDVRSLCRSNASLVETASRLSRDNAALRERANPTGGAAELADRLKREAGV